MINLRVVLIIFFIGRLSKLDTLEELNPMLHNVVKPIFWRLPVPQYAQALRTPSTLSFMGQHSKVKTTIAKIMRASQQPYHPLMPVT